MIELNSHGIHVRQFSKLKYQKNLQHIVTTRWKLKDNNTKEEFNLGIHNPEDTGNALLNRNLLTKFFKGNQIRLVIPNQCHTNNVEVVHEKNMNNPFNQTDALVTQEKNILVGVLTADCVPILLYEPVKKIIASIHAGWRGTLVNIVHKTVYTMKQTFQAVPPEMIACIGPSISAGNYEVGYEILSKFMKQYPDLTVTFQNKNDGKGYLDLKEINKIQLLNEGVKEENIEISEICTFSSSDLFYSARKEGFNTGRFFSGIMMT